MKTLQSGVLAPVPPAARYLTFSLNPRASPRRALTALAEFADGVRAGLVFAAFGRALDAFEAQLRRMVGAEDGIADALFRFTRPVSGSYYWCPPVRRGRIDLGRLI